MTTIFDLWARVPDVGCKGLCAEACGPIGCTEGEAALMQEAADGKPLTVSRKGVCGYLVDGKCSVYAVRPLICRFFGAVVDRYQLMRCPHGCKPDRAMSNLEAKALTRQMEKVGGASVFSVLDDSLVIVTDEAADMTDEDFKRLADAVLRRNAP